MSFRDRDEAIEELENRYGGDEIRRGPAGFESVHTFLTWGQTKQLASGGITIGSHTVAHPIMSSLDDDRRRVEVMQSKQEIRASPRHAVQGIQLSERNVERFFARSDKESCARPGTLPPSRKIAGSERRANRPLRAQAGEYRTWSRAAAVRRAGFRVLAVAAIDGGTHEGGRRCAWPRARRGVEQILSERMRIGVVVPRLMGGGADQCVVDLAIGMKDAGLHPTVVCLERVGYLADLLTQRGITVIGPLKKKGNDPRAPLRLAGLLREHRVDVAHCHNWGGLVDTVVAAKLARMTPVLHTQHGLDYGFSHSPDHLRSRLRTFAKTMACKGVSRVATVSREVAQMVTREWHVPSSRVSVVHNGVRVPATDEGVEMRACWRSELGLGPSDVLIGTVAVFRPVKDLLTLLEAMALVAKDAPQARLVLMGAGPQKEELEAAVERLGLKSIVHFPGFRRDATQLLPALECSCCRACRRASRSRCWRRWRPTCPLSRPVSAATSRYSTIRVRDSRAAQVAARSGRRDPRARQRPVTPV
jgi:glycosyltransferase involved in cell wall biosynthesis